MADITVHVTLPNKRVVKVTVPGDDIVFAVMDKVKVLVVKWFCLNPNTCTKLKSHKNNSVKAYQNYIQIVHISFEMYAGIKVYCLKL